MPAVVADPYGEVVRRWTHLSPADQQWHARRLLGVGLAESRIADPDAGCWRHYAALVEAAVAGDEIALGWLADSHRPLLLTRGRAIFEHDPAEWGAVCLEALVRALRFVSRYEAGPWLRRQVAQQLCHRLGRIVRRELVRRRAERACDPVDLPPIPVGGVGADPHPELSEALEVALAELDPATDTGLRAAAAGRPLAPVAAAHQLSHAALKQRMVRARRRLAPQLATFRRCA
jgi:DNA-directed RNA polymerase specialized sigma24 family protein